MDILFPPEWYSYSKLFIYGFFSLLILVLWRMGRPSSRSKVGGERTKDPALLWLGLAYSVWSFDAAVATMGWPIYLSDYLRPVLSSFNSSFFLLAMIYFDYGPNPFKDLQGQADSRRRTSASIAVIGVTVTAMFLADWMISIANVRETFIPDFVLSIVTTTLIAVVMFRSFRHRDFKLIAFVSPIPIVALMLLQIPEIILDLRIVSTELRYAIHLSSCSTLALLFLVLVVSDLHAESRLPQSSKLKLTFTGEKNEEGRYAVILELPEKGKVVGRLTPIPHLKLLVFALLVKRLDAADRAIWRVNKKNSQESNMRFGDFTITHNDPSTLAKAFGEEEEPRTIFDNVSQGWYRLAVEKENITIAPSLLEGEKTLEAIADIDALRPSPAQDLATDTARPKEL